MKQCIKIRILGNVQEVAYRAFVQKHATALGIEGTVRNSEDGSVLVYASGLSENLDKLIDYLYKGTTSSRVDTVSVEPLINEMDFRGVFRVIGD